MQQRDRDYELEEPSFLRRFFRSRLMKILGCAALAAISVVATGGFSVLVGGAIIVGGAVVGAGWGALSQNGSPGRHPGKILGCAVLAGIGVLATGGLSLLAGAAAVLGGGVLGAMWGEATNYLNWKRHVDSEGEYSVNIVDSEDEDSVVENECQPTTGRVQEHLGSREELERENAKLRELNIRIDQSLNRLNRLASNTSISNPHSQFQPPAKRKKDEPKKKPPAYRKNSDSDDDGFE